MSRVCDYEHRMSRAQYTDKDIEVLISGGSPGHPDLAPLVGLVTIMRQQTTEMPPPSVVAEFAAAASKLALADSQSLMPDIAQGPPIPFTIPLRNPFLQFRRRLAIGLGTLVSLFGLTGGIALAADAAIPGQLLYPVDIALESIGFGAGSTAERLAEADALVAHQQFAAAIQTLGEAVAAADSRGDAEGVSMALDALSAMAGALGGSATGAEVDPDSQSMLADLKTFLSENVGPGSGLDGMEFGQGVADIARNGSNGVSGKDSPNKAAGVPENAGPKADTGPPAGTGKP